MTAQRSYLEHHEVAGRDFVIDLNERLGELRDAPQKDTAGIALVSQVGLNIVLTAVRAGSAVADSVNRGVIAFHVLSGRLQFEAGDDSYEVTPGQIAVVDTLVPHRMRAIDDSTILTTVAMLEERGADIGSRSRADPGRTDVEAADGSNTEALLPDQEEQRQLMLRELAEQREHMRDEGVATPEADRSIGEPVEHELERISGEDEQPQPR